MPVLVSDVLERAQTLIQDETNVRWPLPELCGWLNDGQREVAIHKPSASARSVVVELVEGTRQTIPQGDLMLLRVIRNLDPSSTDDVRIGRRSVRQVARDVLDTTHPDWHDLDVVRPTQVAKHFIFDDSDPTAFYVYPGNDGTGKLEVLSARSPAPIDATGTDLSDYDVNLSLPDVYANALLDYVLYRAYDKDSTHAANAERSAKHFQAFAASLGIKATQEAGAAPRPKVTMDD